MVRAAASASQKSVGQTRPGKRAVAAVWDYLSFEGNRASKTPSEAVLRDR
jgi:hypothetical protein